MSAWWLVVLAGLLEVVWAIGLKLSNGFTRPVVTAVTVLAMAASLWFLGLAAKTLPIGVAYAVWVGIGAVGVAAAGVLLLGEPLSAVRALLMLLLIGSLVGLKLTTS